ncbi:hypothetical protein DHEL01_v204003 [Diaporthe helianthi]|uniref:Uncharacterized protein n=1 Tax=Diaporthe helianthi TaxID=158607 RepID=A0A2P5I557_DIAHE|nr:hypothetical protein DHEL01_v204003 [Diaporthe helianthi]
MAGNISTNMDAEVSKFFIHADKCLGVDAFEEASKQIPGTGRPATDSPLKKTFALEEGKGSASTRFVPTPREEPKADDGQAEANVPRDSWVCFV